MSFCYETEQWTVENHNDFLGERLSVEFWYETSDGWVGFSLLQPIPCNHAHFASVFFVDPGSIHALMYRAFRFPFHWSAIFESPSCLLDRFLSIPLSFPLLVSSGLVHPSSTFASSQPEAEREL